MPGLPSRTLAGMVAQRGFADRPDGDDLDPYEVGCAGLTTRSPERESLHTFVVTSVI